MTAPATIPFAAPHSTGAAVSTTASGNRNWTPSDRDRLVFQWVKFEGHTQSWVAEQLEMNQSSVSRMIERYERWIAHGGPGLQGGLSHDERLRAARWLTYERNEWILASALRIAGEMERALDTSKSTISPPGSAASAETEIRTEHKTIDRSGVAARFLRLAYRINMEQLKLAELDPLPPLDPLTIDELEEGRLPTVVTADGDAIVPVAAREDAAVAECAVSEETAGPPPVAMHETHTSPATESISTVDEPATCDDFSGVKKPLGHACEGAEWPPQSIGRTEMEMATQQDAGEPNPTECVPYTNKNDLPAWVSGQVAQ